MIHANENLKILTNAVGRKYREAIKEALLKKGYSPTTQANWLALRTAVPPEAQDTVSSILKETYKSFFQDLGIDEFKDDFIMSTFKKGSTTVKHEREIRNLSQDALAKIIGVTQATISNIESDKRKVGNLQVARAIAQYFNLPIEAFKDFN